MKDRNRSVLPGCSSEITRQTGLRFICFLDSQTGRGTMQTHAGLYPRFQLSMSSCCTKGNAGELKKTHANLT
ncbi:hypothetical protein T12_130 [Trichinella patagoniensis]|uniref:Uncharacterized protein n=1 Tax=Trichinella patagoniensis TaxID=990121 RepID=A0A0V0ZSF4_9BILA|nr:hypothetical protein T12_130 [Trichinella patagoniensis]